MSALLELDVKTILSLIVVGNIASAATLAAYQWRGGYEPGVRRFMAGSLCLAAAWTLLYLRGLIATPLSVHLGNTLIIVGFNLQCLALDGAYRPDAGLDRRYAVLAAAGVLAFLALADQGDHIRVAAASFATLPPYFALGLSMLRAREAAADGPSRFGRLSLRLFIGWASSAYALVLALRGSFAIANGAGFTLLTPALVQTMAFVPLFIFTTAATIGFTLLAKERSDARLADSEEKYRTLVERASEAIAIIQDGRFVFANPRLGELIGTAVDDIIGRPMADFICPEDLALASERHAARMAGLSTAEAYDLRVADGTGAARWVVVSSSLIQWRGRPASLGLLTDIDDRKRQEARVAELLADREALLREVHHRVKNNLTVAMSLLSLQSVSSSGKDATAILDDARNRLQSMMQLYDLLNARGDFRQASAQDFLERLVAEVSIVFPEAARTRFRLELGDWNLDVDRLARLGLIVNELVTNAMKYAFLGVPEPEIYIGARFEGDRAIVTIRDNGKGLPSSPSSEGLGLRLVTLLARQLGAELSVDGASGASFTLRMPR